MKCNIPKRPTEARGAVEEGDHCLWVTPFTHTCSISCHPFSNNNAEYTWFKEQCLSVIRILAATEMKQLHGYYC